jgi:protein-tyrosine phosphatase
VRAGKLVLIHCHAGVGRSALLCACYLIYAGMDLAEAWQTVQSKRVHAFLNSKQQAALNEFAQVLARDRAAVSVPIDGPTPDARLFVADE